MVFCLSLQSFNTPLTQEGPGSLAMVRDALCLWAKILIIYTLEEIVCKLILWIILKQVLPTPCVCRSYLGIHSSQLGQEMPYVDVARQPRISKDDIYI